LAKAYLLFGVEPFSIGLPGMPPMDFAEENFKTYFYATKEGTDLNASLCYRRSSPANYLVFAVPVGPEGKHIWRTG
jgi:hypothetical protein